MKRILLIMIVFILSGCSASYELTLNSDYTWKEEFYIIPNESGDEIYQGENLIEGLTNRSDIVIQKYYNEDNLSYFDGNRVPGVEFYDQKPYNKDTGKYFYSNFTNNDIVYSYAIKKCYSSFEIQNNNDIYTLKTNNKCKLFDSYPLLENLSIKLNIDNDMTLLYCNADIIESKSCVWNINKNNYNSKNIVISYSKKIENKDDKNIKQPEKEIDNESKNDKNDTNFVIVLVVSIMMVIATVFVIIYNNYKNK